MGQLKKLYHDEIENGLLDYPHPEPDTGEPDICKDGEEWAEVRQKEAVVALDKEMEDKDE